MNLRLIGMTLIATSVFAQGPGRRQHGMAAAKTTEVQSYLNLTDAQIASLKEIRQSEMAALKPIFQQIRPLRQELRTQEQAGNTDAAAKLMQSIQSLEQQAAPTRASFQQQAMAVLTPVQKTKVAALQNAVSLMPAIHEATMLNLVTPPKGMGGPGGFGPEGMHPGAPPE